MKDTWLHVCHRCVQPPFCVLVQKLGLQSTWLLVPAYTPADPQLHCYLWSCHRTCQRIQVTTLKHYHDFEAFWGRNFTSCWGKNFESFEAFWGNVVQHAWSIMPGQCSAHACHSPYQHLLDIPHLLGIPIGEMIQTVHMWTTASKEFLASFLAWDAVITSRQSSWGKGLLKPSVQQATWPVSLTFMDGFKKILFQVHLIHFQVAVMGLVVTNWTSQGAKRESFSGKKPTHKNSRSSGCGLPRMMAFRAWRPMRT